tara:strand:- start:658 stop:1179 length:522 start_codon:yes stop_codon:yes gene_type:complete
MKTIGDNTIPPEFDPFNTPVPGQSLTDEPGNYPWEHPPRKTDPEVVLEEIWRSITTPAAVEEMIYLLEAGVPVEGIARTIVFAGFMEGEFTPDLGFTLAEPIMEMITAIGMRAGIKNLKISLQDPGNSEFKMNMVKLKQAGENKQMENMGMDKPAVATKAKAKGLLAKPEEAN